VSSHCYRWKLAHWSRVNSRQFESSILCRPHQSPNTMPRVKVSSFEEPLISATRQTLALNKGWPESPDSPAKDE
jgi:hypothetical protein